MFISYFFHHPREVKRKLSKRIRRDAWNDSAYLFAEIFIFLRHFSHDGSILHIHVLIIDKKTHQASHSMSELYRFVMNNCRTHVFSPENSLAQKFIHSNFWQHDKSINMLPGKTCANYIYWATTSNKMNFHVCVIVLSVVCVRLFVQNELSHTMALTNYEFFALSFFICRQINEMSSISW